MQGVTKFLNYFLLLIMVLLFTGTGCATQNPWAKKRKKSSHVSETQLGRNRYYYSVSYQKKLNKSYKR